MANVKSAKKRILVTIKKTLRNRVVKSQTKTAIKKLRTICAAGDQAAARSQLPATIAVIDKAASKGVIHKNNASRKKARLTKLVNKVGVSA